MDRPRLLRFAGPLLALGLAACNMIFGVQGGESATTTASASATGASTSSGTGGATSSTGPAGTGGTGGAGGQGGTGGGAPCAPDRVRACAAEPCPSTTVTTTGAFTLGILVHGDLVYYGAGTDNLVRALRYDGSNPQQMGSGSDVVSLASDGARLYWNDFYDGTLHSLDFGTPGVVDDVAIMPDSGANCFLGRMTVYAGYLYWTSRSPSGVWRAKADGSEKNAPTAIAKEGDAKNPADIPVGVAVDDTYLYWTDRTAIRRIKVADIGTAGATHEDFSTGEDHPTAITLDADRIYWVAGETYHWLTGETQGSAGTVRSKPKTAQASDMPHEYEATQGDYPRGVLLDGAHVYWTLDSGKVERAPRAGGPVEHYATGMTPHAYELAADCGGIYWTTFDGPSGKASVNAAGRP